MSGDEGGVEMNFGERLQAARKRRGWEEFVRSLE